MAKDNRSGRFDDRVNLVFDELSMGIQWSRPCLVVLFYRSEKTKKTVQTILTGKLKETGQPAISYRVDKQHFDIPLDLLRHPQHSHAVYFIHDLRWGGGRGYSNAYRALNMHREYLVEGNIKAIFWLTEKEGRQLSRFAPDFWAFRHKVVEFPDLPSSRKIRQEKTPGGSHFHGDLKKRTDFQYLIDAARISTAQGCFEEAILQYRKAFRLHPDEIFIPLKIVEIHLSLGRLPAARKLLNKAGKIKSTDQHYRKELNRLTLVSRSVQSKSSGFVENPA
jgi:tetratricopeptide (TPR) repeat protein